MVAEQFDQLADQLALVVSTGTEIAPAHLQEDFLTGILAHLGVHGSVTPIFESTGAAQQSHSPASVTILLSQIAHANRANYGENCV